MLAISIAPQARSALNSFARTIFMAAFIPANLSSVRNRLRSGPAADNLRAMSDPAFQVPVAFDYVATFTWAVSGAIVAIRRRFDIVGVFIVALLSAIGGGLLRDAVFLNRPPAFLVNPAYLSLVAGATVLTAFFSRFLKNLIGPDTVRKIVDIIDALGTPAF